MPLLCVALVLVGLPLGVVVVSLTRELFAGGARISMPSVVLLARSIAYAGGVGLLSTILALAPAWWMRSRPRSSVFLLMVPMLMPSYLAYAGWGLLRAPGSAIGDWIERVGAAQEWIPIMVGRGLAVIGLSLWSWPLAMLVLSAAFRRVDECLVDSLRIEGFSRTSRGFQILSMCRDGVLLAWGLVTLLMLGSAVPFHLAQVPTFTMEVWVALTEAPGRLAPWVQAWPILGVALVASALISKGLLTARDRHAAAAFVSSESRRVGWPLVITVLIWCMGVIMPLAMFATHLKAWRSIPRFLATTSQAIGASAQVGLAVGLGSMVIMVAGWLALASRRPSRWLAGSSMWLLALGVLIPGILVGSAVYRTTTSIPYLGGLSDGPWAEAWAHLARFGFLAGLVGGAMAANESPDLRDLRAIEGCGPVRGAWHMVLKPYVSVTSGLVIAISLLSLHEIESSVILTPAGPGSLANTLLGFLHYFKDEQLCAGGIVVVGGGLLLALVASVTAKAAFRND